MGVFDNFISWLTSIFGVPWASPVLIFALGISYWRYRDYKNVLLSRDSVEEVKQRLQTHGGLRDIYFVRLQSWLSKVDGWLGERKWSGESYDFTLRLAVVYPTLSLLIIWAMTGQNTSGIDDLLPQNLEWWRRWVAIGALGVVAAALFNTLLDLSVWRIFVYLAFPVAVVVALDLAFVGAFAVAFAVVVVVSVVVGGAFAIALVGVGVGAGAVIVTLVGAYLFILVLLYIRSLKSGRLPIFYSLYLSSLLIGLALVARNSQILNVNQGFVLLMLVFNGALPLINSCLDWVSLGVTRSLLTSISQRKYAYIEIARFALFDLLLAIFFLTCLAAICTAYLQMLNMLSQSSGGVQFFELASLFHRLRTDPADLSLWWIYITLFSTLVPTLFHMSIATGSFVVWRMPDRWRQRWLDLLETNDLNEHHSMHVRMARWLTFMDAAAVALALVAMGLILSILLYVLPSLGWWLLYLCEWIAEAMGAPIIRGSTAHI